MATKDETKSEAPKSSEAHTPYHDERGALRLDRPLTPQEAQAVDEERRAEYEAMRRRRFAGATTTEEGRIA